MHTVVLKASLMFVFTFIEHVLFIINHSKLFFSKQFHFISPITSYIIVFLYVVKYHYNHIVNVYNSTLNGVCDTPIGICNTHQKYRCASYTSNGVLVTLQWCASWDKRSTPYLVWWTHYFLQCILTLVYLCLPLFTHVYLCLLFFT